MTDIHCHLLPSVDDGGYNLRQSLEKLKAMSLSGVSKVILTPHGFDGERKNTPEFLTERFNAFTAQVKNAGIDIKLYLGEEIAFDKSFYRQKDGFLTLAESKALLVEFPTVLNYDIADDVYNLAAMGFKPIVAHVERYGVAFNGAYLEEIKSAGGFTQINADTVLKRRGESAYKKCVKFIKSGLIDFIASDTHKFRTPSLKDAELVVVKKCGEEAAADLFYRNAEKIIFNS